MSKIETLWYTRCPVPTPLGIAAQRGWIDDEFKKDGIRVQTLQDTLDPEVRESHFDHRLDNSFRQGGNIPAIWARAAGRDTRVIGLTWTDEAQVILTLPKSGIRSLADLKQRKLGVLTNPASSIDFWQATTLRAYSVALRLVGLDEQAVELIELPRPEPRGTAPRQRGWASERDLRESPEVAALLDGRVDAIFHKGSRGLEVADAIGAEVVFDIGKHPDPKVRINNGSPRTLTVDAKLLEQNLDLAVRLVERVLLAGQWAADHPREALEYVAKETGSSEAAVERAYGADVGQHLRTDLEPSSIEALSDFKDFLFSRGFLKGDFDARAWIDPRPLALARKAAALKPQLAQAAVEARAL
jgi:ABC-type nitrate/sulfonate/bicarbonate transport system substrate-binding protein